MHIILGLVATGVAIYWFFIRASMAKDAAYEVADMAQTAVGAARRFGFRRRADQHPVDSIEEPQLAVAGLASAYLALDSFPTEDARKGLLVGFQTTFDMDLKEAEELAALGQWFVNSCKGADAAVPRLARKLQRIGGGKGLVDAISVIGAIAEGSSSEQSERQVEALDEIKRVFKV